MPSPRHILLPLLLATLPLNAEDSDTANERIPVTRPEMEIHWQVDCIDTWKDLIEAGNPAMNSRNCDLARKFSRAIQLCAYIYQPPGGDVLDNCPDYRAAYSAMQDTDCLGLASALESKNCSDEAP
jgi:hypothetical protein